MWTRGVDTDLFRPDRAIELGFPRPIFVTVGRIAVEKNLEAFLSLDLPGTKVVIGTGPQEAELKRRFPDAKFLGLLENGTLAAHLAAADVFVFPSLTDTFGVVQLEAARQRCSDRRLSGHRAEGRRRQQSHRGLERGSARGLPGGAADSARRMSHIRAAPLLGKQRPAIHRTCAEGRHRRLSPSRTRPWRQPPPRMVDGRAARR